MITAFANDIELVGFDGQTVEITRDMGDLINIADVYSVTSTTFTLPLHENMRAFGITPKQLNGLGTMQMSGTFRISGGKSDLLQAVGKYRITGIDLNAGTIEINATAGNNRAAATLAGRRLRDLDLSAYDDTYDQAFIGTYPNGCWQPIIWSGRNSTYYPSLPAYTLVDEIATAAGLSLTIPDNNVIDALQSFYQFPVAAIMRNGQRWLDSIAESRLLPSQSITGSGSLIAGATHTNSATSVPGTVFDPQNGGPCRVDFSIPFTITNTPTGTYTETWAVTLEWGAIQAGVVIPQGTTSGTITGSIFFSKGMPGGAGFFLRLAYSITAGGGGCTYNYNIAIANPVLSFTPLAGYDTTVYNGTTFNFEGQLPDWSQLEYVQEVAALVGCRVIVRNGLLGLHSIRKLGLVSNSTIPYAPDWSALTADSGQITYDVPGVGQTTRFAYEKDKDTEAYTAADYTVAGNEILPTKVERVSKFAASLQASILGAFTAAIPYWDASETGDPTPTAVLPRLLLRPTIDRLFFGPGLTTDYALFGSDGVEPYGLFWSELVAKFYQPLVNYAATPMQIEVGVKLDGRESQLLSLAPDGTPYLLVPVYLQQFGGHCAILSINSSTDDDISLVKLIRLWQ